MVSIFKTMSDQEILLQVRSRISEIRRRKIWQKACAVAKKFGVSKQDTIGGCFATKTDCLIKVGKKELSIQVHPAGQFGQNDYLTVRVDDEIVFAAHQYDSTENPHRALRINRRDVEVETYKRGNWWKLLDIKKIEKERSKTNKETKPAPEPLIARDPRIFEDFDLAK